MTYEGLYEGLFSFIISHYHYFDNMKFHRPSVDVDQQIVIFQLQQESFIYIWLSILFAHLFSCG